MGILGGGIALITPMLIYHGDGAPYLPSLDDAGGRLTKPRDASLRWRAGVMGHAWSILKLARRCWAQYLAAFAAVLIWSFFFLFCMCPYKL